MKRWIALLAVSALALGGCFKDFNVDVALRDRPPIKAEPTPPVFPDQVQPGNAHQIAEALWDEIDREAAQASKSRP